MNSSTGLDHEAGGQLREWLIHVYRIVTSRMDGNKRDSTRRVVPRFVLNLVITVVITMRTATLGAPC